MRLVVETGKEVGRFKMQTKKGASVTDCANVAVVRQFNMPANFGFDQVYAKTFGVRLETKPG